MNSFFRRHAGRCLPVAAGAGLFLLSLLSPAAPRADVIRIGGSGGPLPVMRALCDAFRVRHEGPVCLSMPSLGSGGGVKALLEGALDLAVTTRPLTGEERKRGAVQEPMGRTPFIFISSCSCAEEGLTLDRVARIYAGEEKTWPNGTPVRLVLRPETDSDTAVLKTMSGDVRRAVRAAMVRRGMVFAYTDQENADMVQRIPGSLGTCTLAQVIAEGRKVHILPLDGVAPTLEALRDGSYRHYKTAYLVTAGTPGGLVKSLLDFLRSDLGREILLANGYAP